MARQITAAFWTRVTARRYSTIQGTPKSHAPCNPTISLILQFLWEKFYNILCNPSYYTGNQKWVMKPEMSDKLAPYHSAMSWHSCLLFWLLVVAIMREKVFYKGRPEMSYETRNEWWNQKWVMKPEMSDNIWLQRKKIYLFIMVLQYKSREI